MLLEIRYFEEVGGHRFGRLVLDVEGGEYLLLGRGRGLIRLLTRLWDSLRRGCRGLCLALMNMLG